MHPLARWSFVAVVVVGAGAGVWALNHDPGPNGAVLEDPAHRVAAVRWVQDVRSAPDISVADDVSDAWPLPVREGPHRWDTRVFYLGGTCETGVHVRVPAGGLPLRVDGFESGSRVRSCGGMGVTHAVDIRWADGRAPARVTAEQPRG